MAPNNVLVIWLDFEEGVDSYAKEVGKEHPKFISAAQVNEVFNQTDVSIVGNFTVEEAKQLADLLNAGALPVELKEIYSTSVGAQFGEQALQKRFLQESLVLRSSFYLCSFLSLAWDCCSRHIKRIYLPYFARL